MLRVAALLLVEDRRVLMVRARGRDVLYLPGGKIEPGETAIRAAAREGREEIAVDLRPEELTEFATVLEPAHGQGPDTLVSMTLFRVAPGAAQSGSGPSGSARWHPVAAAEVDAVEWVTSADADRCPPAGVRTLELLVEAGLVD